MKITILTPPYWPSIGGVQTGIRLTSAYLARQGQERKWIKENIKVQ